MEQVGKTFYDEFGDKGITKIVTIEASGIAIAMMVGQCFGVPVLFAKKAKSKNLDGDLYTSKVHSYTYGKDYDITLSACRWICPIRPCVVLLPAFLRQENR